MVACGLSEEEAFKLEIERISFWKDLVDLCNKTDGGDGTSGLVMSEASRLKMSEKAKGRPGIKSMLGRRHSDATKAKMRAAKLGKLPNNAGKKYTKKPFTADHREKLSKAHQGKVMSPETCAKLSERTKAQWANPAKRPRRQEKLGV
jgi:hypothetical protein